MKATFEREIKLDADPSFLLPELPGTVTLLRNFTSTYFDTAGNSLLEAGITLRRRVEGRKGLWQLKIPSGPGRLEIEAPGGPSGPPPEIADLLFMFLHGRKLKPVVALRTRRETVLATSGDRTLAEVSLDSVSVMAGRSVKASFKEAEIELRDGTEKDLDALQKLLLSAGAKRSTGVNKLARALGMKEIPKAAADSDQELLKGAIRSNVQALMGADPGTRIDQDPEFLHEMRVAVRRLRAILRVAGPMFGGPVDDLRSELAWIGDELGAVRDLDVLTEKLGSEVQAMEGPDRSSAALVMRRLDDQRVQAKTNLLDAMGTRRYVRLIRKLEGLRESLSSDTSVDLNKMSADEFRKLMNGLKSLEKTPASEQLHRARLLGKRARYAAEIVSFAKGKTGGKYISDLKKLQDVLGDHQDAVVAEERLRGLLDDRENEQFVLGRLVERQRLKMHEARENLPKAADEVGKSGRRAWR